MSICLACQPYVFDDMINNPVFRGSGLIARFMYCFPMSNIGTRKYDTQAVPEQVAESYKNLVYKLLGAKFTYHDEKELYLHFDAKAYSEFVDYYNNFIERTLSRIWLSARIGAENITDLSCVCAVSFTVSSVR